MEIEITPKSEALRIIHRIMFETTLTHLDEVLPVARIIVEEIKFNCLDSALPFWNEALKEL